MKYIVAVSGGVDSVVLLDMLVHGRLKLEDGNWRASADNIQPLTSNLQLVVAHFDHGVREESAEDAKLVEGLAQKYGLPFEVERVELGSAVSEEQARDERYKFLQKSRKKHNASHIIMAHHQDDMVETAIFNISRGTGWRGLASLKSTDGILRPLLHLNKDEIYSHARKHGLDWNEDITNQDERYSRNYIRGSLIPKASNSDPNFKSKMNSLISNVQSLQQEIDEHINSILELARLDEANFILSRHKLVMWPQEVSLEILRAIVLQLDPDWHPTTLQLSLMLNFCKTSRPGKTYEVSKNVKVSSTKSHLEFTRLK